MERYDQDPGPWDLELAACSFGVLVMSLAFGGVGLFLYSLYRFAAEFIASH